MAILQTKGIGVCFCQVLVGFTVFASFRLGGPTKLAGLAAGGCPLNWKAGCPLELETGIAFRLG